MKGKIAFIILAVAIGVGSLVISTSGEASHPHYKLQEFKSALEKGSKSDERFMTIYGKVKEGTIKKKGAAADFVIIDGDVEMPVHFTGKTLLPDTFKDGADAALDGRYDTASGKFVADKAMAKCASKYESAGDGMKLGHPENIKRYN